MLFRRPPYWAALWLVRWAAQHHGLIRGRLLLTGRSVPQSAREVVDITVAVLVNEYGLTRFDEFLDSLGPDADTDEPSEKWGTGSTAESGQNAMLRLLGAS